MAGVKWFQPSYPNQRIQKGLSSFSAPEAAFTLAYPQVYEWGYVCRYTSWQFIRNAPDVTATNEFTITFSNKISH
jgi:hypothetical protein